jgi:lysophospholipase L1-like esterase
LFPEAVIIACGGAVTANFYDQQHSGNAAMPPQLEQLRKLALSENSPDAVLLSVGGNDSQFAGIVTLCTLAPPGQVCGAEGKNPPPSEVVAKIANSLRRVYRDVNRAINDDEARRHRSGHYAPIVVVPYPRILPAQQSGLQGGNCQALISAEEVTYLNAFLDALNLEIAAAVGSLTSDHVPVFYASDVVPAFQPNHTICATKDSYATFESNPLVMADNGLKQTLPPELLHPNALGYKAMARAIAAWSANRLMMTDPKAPDYIAVDTKKLSWFDNTVANATLNQLDIYMAGGDATINEKGFAPSSTIIFRLDSIPRIVGSASATDDGSITATVTIPTDTAPGLHHLHAIGLDSIGAQHDVVETIWVAPPYTPYAVIVVLAGLTGLAVGFAGIRRNRKATLATA